MAAQYPTGGELILRSLKAHGVEYLFANAGSDFAPVVEAYSRSVEQSDTLPQPVLVPHEGALVAMAHGYWLVTGRVQAAMVHVNVGLANAAMGIINARADDVPVILLSGRTPLTEHDRPGARRTPIQYGQEQFDQAAMVREMVKWHYELRYPETGPALISRAIAIATSEPTGPVYLSLPREPLAEAVSVPCNVTDLLQTAAAPMAPEADAVARAAELLHGAKRPLIICQRGDPQGLLSKALVKLAETHSIPVAEVFATRKTFPGTHPMAVGPDLRSLLPQADVILVLDAPVAWLEFQARPAADAQVIHVGPDPLMARMPVRSYRTSLAIAANPAETLAALDSALSDLGTRHTQGPDIDAAHAAYSDRMSRAADIGSRGIATKAYVAQCVAEVLGSDGVVFNERGAPAPFYPTLAANQFFGNTPAGGLGWALPAALGAQLADRDRLVVCVHGDGSHLFANPVVCHQVAAAYALPVLTIVLNNSGWDAVRLSTLEVYPDGAASRLNQMPLTTFESAPDHAGVARACGAWALAVESAEDLPGALEQAIEIIRTEKRQVLLDVKIRPE